VAGCCECGDEPSGSCATELVSWLMVHVGRYLKAELSHCTLQRGLEGAVI
jgi:hypothetical protein